MLVVTVKFGEVVEMQTRDGLVRFHFNRVFENADRVKFVVKAPQSVRVLRANAKVRHPK